MAETAPPPMSDPSTSIFHKATGGSVKDSKLITSGRDTIYNVHNSYLNLRVFPDDVIGFIKFVAQPFVWWTRRADGKERDSVDLSDIVPPDPSSLPVCSIADMYVQCMLECMAGYPLYSPKPFSEFSVEYSRKGVNIGDVGFVTEDGTFDFLFNICPLQNSVINPPNLPDGFILETPDHSTTRDLESFAPNTCFLSNTVTKTGSDRYVCEGPKGAILVLPEGAIEGAALHKGRFTDLAKRHGVEWYQYTKARGRGISNGSLYLVTSFTKCTQWGVAVFNRPCKPGQGLTCVSDPLGWNGSGALFSKVSGSNQGDMPNQCVLLRGYKIMIRQDIFDNLSTRQRATRIRGGGGTGFSSKIKKLLTGKSPLTQTTMSTATKPDDVVLHANFNSPPVHPSDFINAALLSQVGRDFVIKSDKIETLVKPCQNPDAKVALTHDDVWCDLLRNNFPELDYAELMNSARLYTSTIDEYGGVSLEKISDSSNVQLDGDSGQFQGTEAPIQTLPRELVEYILLLLDIDSMLTCTLVNKEFNEIIQSSTSFQDFLTRQPYLEEFNRLRVVRVGFDHVEGFCTSLSNLYKSVAGESIDRNRWKVTKISMLKSTITIEHEYLVAEVVCGQMIVYLRLERKVQIRGAVKRSQERRLSKATPKTQTSDDSTPLPNKSAYSRDNSRPTFNPFLPYLASDVITYSKVYMNLVSSSSECVEVIRFPEGKGLSLPQFAVLARCANSFAPNWTFLGENADWLVHVMGETAKLIETDFTLEKLSKRKRGVWKGLLTSRKPTLFTIEQIKTMYDEKWVVFIQDIHDSINNKQNSEPAFQGKLEEEREKRAEVERLAAENVQEGD